MGLRPEDSTNLSPDHAQVAFHPPLLLAAALAAGFLLRAVVPLRFLPVKIAEMLGPGLCVAAFVWFFWAVGTLIAGKASIPTGEPTNTIVVRGPYRFSRNPIYLAMVALIVDAGVWVNSLWFFGFAAVSIPIFIWGVISREEKYLERKFAEEYISYKSRVRRWL